MSDLENKIAQTLADKIAKKIDKEILDTLMIDVLKDEGWIETKVNPAFTDIGMNKVPSRFDDWYSKTAEWIHLNARDDYKLLKGQWLFKDPRDATAFLLKWS
jgi:hypothetical protein